MVPCGQSLPAQCALGGYSTSANRFTHLYIISFRIFSPTCTRKKKNTKVGLKLMKREEIYVLIRNRNILAWGYSSIDSIGKMLSVQAWEAELNPQNPLNNARCCYVYYLTSGEGRQADSWGSLGNQTNPIGMFQINERPYLKKQGGLLASMRKHINVHEHVSSRTLLHIHTPK